MLSHKPRSRSVVFLGVVLAGALASMVVQADESSPDSRANAAPQAQGSGEASVSSSGSMSLAVPLELPTPRGNGLSAPVTVSYSGSTELGHVGVGWEVQLSTIREISSRAHRSVVPPRYELDLLGEHYSLFQIQDNSRGDQYRPLVSARNLVADQYSSGWFVRDDAGRGYWFSPSYTPGVWLLSRFGDADGNEVQLHYDVVSHSPPVGFIGPNTSRVDEFLSSVTYSFADDLSSSTACPKYTIDLSYRPLTEVMTTLPGHGIRVENGELNPTYQLLKQVTVRSATSCTASTPLRSYLFSYSTHTDVALPVLQRVDQLGTGETDASAALPLVSYEYGSVTGNTQSVRYALPTSNSTLSIPSDIDGYFSLSTNNNGLEHTRVVDMTGDGIPDLLNRKGTGSSMQTYLYRGRPRAMGGQDISFSELPPELLATTESPSNPLPPVQMTGIMQLDLGGATTPIKGYRVDTLIEYIDWNGDGRVDIVDARGQDSWIVYLNNPGNADTTITWTKITVDMRAIKADFAANMFLSAYLNDTSSLQHCNTDCGQTCNTCQRTCEAPCSCGVGDLVCQNSCRTHCEVQCQPSCDACTQRCERVSPTAQVNVNPGNAMPTSRQTRVTYSGTCKAYRLEGGVYKLKVVTCPQSEWLSEWKLQDVNGDSYVDLVRNSRAAFPHPDSCRVCPAQTSDPTNLPDECRDGCTDGFVDDMQNADNRILVYYNPGAYLSSTSGRWSWSAPAVVLYDGTTGPESTIGPACGLDRVRQLANGYTYSPCTLSDVDGDGLPDYITETTDSYYGEVSAPQSVQQVAMRATGDPRHEGGISFDRVTSILLPGRLNLQSPGFLLCPTNSTVTREQDSALVDLNRDGRPDWVYWGRAAQGADGQPLVTASVEATPDVASTLATKTVPGWTQPARGKPPSAAPGTSSTGWWVRFNNGVAFGPSVPIASPTAVPFQLQRTLLRCNGSDSEQLVTGGLLDIDGDGTPEVVQSTGDASYKILRLEDGVTGLDDIPRVSSSLRLTAVRNAQLGTFHIGYGSAKAYEAWAGSRLPFPEAVVAKTWRTFDKGLAAAQSDAAELPTYYLYGDGRLDWDPFELRYTFGGYRRKVEYRTPALRSSVGEVSYRSASVDALFLGSYAFHGLLNVHARFEANGASVLGLLSARAADLPTHPFLRGADSTEMTLLPGMSLRPYDGHTMPKSQIIFATSESSWRGSAPPASESSPWATQSKKVMTPDACGRVVETHDLGDLAGTAPDLCTSIAYINACEADQPVSAYPRKRLDVPYTMRVHSCTDNATLSLTTFGYDDAVDRSVGRGHPTSIRTEVHDLENPATPLGTYTGETRSYDTVGNLTGYARQMGASLLAPPIKTTSYTNFDPWKLQASTVTEGGVGMGTQLATNTRFDPITMLPTQVVDPNGVVHRNSYDRFGRPTMSTVAASATGTEYLLSTVKYLGEDPASSADWALGRRVRTEKLRRWLRMDETPATADVSTSTTYFDEIGRVRYTEVPLGGDYGGATLATGFTQYDALGRISFVADPFIAGESVTDRYGTTRRYFNDGSLRCEIRSPYFQALESSNANYEIAPTCVDRLFDNRALIVRTRGPIENLPGSQASGSYHETVTDASGKTLSIARFDHDARVSYAKLTYDALGNLATVSRSLSPTDGSQAQVWRFAYDSRGFMLRKNEPGLAQVSFEYDLVGNNTRISWPGSDGSIREVRNSFDALGRMTDRQALRGGALESRNSWFYDAAANDPRHVFAHGLMGRLSYSTTDGHEDIFYSYGLLGDPDQRTWAYGATDQVSEQIEEGPDGRPETHSYQRPGGPALGTEKAVYTYDSGGRMSQIDWLAAAGAETLWTASQVSPRGQIGRQDFGDGAVTTTTYGPSGRRLFRSETLSFVAAPSLASTQTTQVTDYDVEGRKLGVLLSTGASTYRRADYTYDAQGHLAREIARNNAATLSDRNFSYDPLGNLIDARDDIVGRDTRFVMATTNADLLCTSSAGPIAPAFTSVAGAALIRAERTGANVGTPIKTAAPVAPACDYQFDEVGQLVREGSGALGGPSGARTYTYDLMGRVLTIVGADGARADLDYGADSVASVRILVAGRVSREDKRFGESIERSRFAGQEGWEYRIAGPSGNVAFVRALATGQLILYPHGDGRYHLEVTGPDGKLTQTTSFDAWGNPMTALSDPGDPEYVKYQWNGADTLESLGVLQMGARLYDPMLARFIQRDPLIVPRKADQLNPYAYAHGDPINKSDSSGLDPLSDCPPEICGPPPAQTYGSSGLRGAEMDGIHEQLRIPLEVAAMYDSPVTRFVGGLMMGGISAEVGAVNAFLHPIDTATHTLEMVETTYHDQGGGMMGVAAVVVAMSPLQPLQMVGDAIVAGDAAGIGFAVGAAVVGGEIGLLTEGASPASLATGALKEAMPLMGAALPKMPKMLAAPMKGAEILYGQIVKDQRTQAEYHGTIDVGPTLERIQRGEKYPHRNDGTTFRNRIEKGRTEPGLPVMTDPDYYKEYVHPSSFPGFSKGPGPQRIVIGAAGETWYTPDHYFTFIRIGWTP